MNRNDKELLQQFARGYNRRTFMRDLSMSIGGAALALPGAARPQAYWQPDDQSSPGAATASLFQGGKKLGIALVGLGRYSTGQLAPALQETKNCRLSGIVTGSPEKVDDWKRKYNIPDKNVYNYLNFNQISDNPDIDIVYVVLPNAMHAEYAVRAAQAGKHVICEKPMATTVKDCQAIIDACEKAGKKLSIGYRLHFEPHHLEMMRLGQKEVYGPVKVIKTENGFRMGDSDSWRVDRQLSGGGPLMDMGIYCVQGVIYTKGQIPVSVTARYHPVTDKKRFNEVEQGISWQMQFRDGTAADCQTSYAENKSRLRAEATKGWFELEPAYGYGGIQGRTSSGRMDISNVQQQARQMDDFASCILNDRKTPVPGEMGLRDVAILEAIYRAADTGNKIAIKGVPGVVDAAGNR